MDEILHVCRVIPKLIPPYHIYVFEREQTSSAAKVPKLENKHV
jgi:hypothetical protein